MNLNYFFKLLKSYRQDLYFSRDSNVKIFNFWEFPDPENLWFHGFVNHHKLIPSGKAVSIYSVFGDRFKMNFDLFRPKIFFTGENAKYRPNYIDNCLNDVDLALGTDYINKSNYLRFPIWYLHVFKPWFDFNDIQNWVVNIENLNKYSETKFNRKFCSLVSIHDPLGYRQKIFELLSPIDHIWSGGQFLRNTDELKTIYKDNKIDFIQNFKFNISVENSNKAGYVTEKIFDSLVAGCLPIYWGSDFEPETRILNQNRIIFYNPEKEELFANKIDYLNSNSEDFKNFYNQNVFNQGAAEVIYDDFCMLKKMFAELI